MKNIIVIAFIALTIFISTGCNDNVDYQDIIGRWSVDISDSDQNYLMFSIELKEDSTLILYDDSRFQLPDTLLKKNILLPLNGDDIIAFNRYGEVYMTIDDSTLHFQRFEGSDPEWMFTRYNTAIFMTEDIESKIKFMYKGCIAVKQMEAYDLALKTIEHSLQIDTNFIWLDSMRLLKSEIQKLKSEKIKREISRMRTYNEARDEWIMLRNNEDKYKGYQSTWYVYYWFKDGWKSIKCRFPGDFSRDIVAYFPNSIREENLKEDDRLKITFTFKYVNSRGEVVVDVNEYENFGYK